MAKVTSLAYAACLVAALSFPASSAAHDHGYGGGEVFEVTLMPCSEELCGVASDTVIRKGKVKVDGKGQVKVEFKHGPENEGLCLEFQEWNGVERLLIGDFTSNDEGNAEARVGTLEVKGVMGLFFVTDCADESFLVTGFSTHPRQVEDDDGDQEEGDDDAEDPDDDGIANDDDPDDDNDGILDEVDANPLNANFFDDVNDARSLKTEFRKEKRDLKDDYRAALRSLKDGHKSDKRELSADYKARRGELN